MQRKKENERERETSASGQRRWFYLSPRKTEREMKREKNRKQKCILVVVEASRQGGLNQRGSRTGI
jgi:hypothetical protein